MPKYLNVEVVIATRNPGLCANFAVRFMLKDIYKVEYYKPNIFCVVHHNMMINFTGF